MLKIRLQRFGKKKAPQYRLVVIESSKKRNGEPVEVLGFYNPKTKELISNTERIAYWKSNGAQTSETAEFVLTKTPIHDLVNGPYKFVTKSRADKENSKQALLAQGKKNTPAKKKKVEAAASAAAKEQEAKEAASVAKEQEAAAAETASTEEATAA